MLELVRALA